MMWLGAEDSECWGLMRLNRASTSPNGIECFLHAVADGAKVRAPEFTAGDDGVVACRTNAVTSRTYVSTGRSGQGFSDTYRRACERVAADPNTPRYAAIDIIMWLTLTDPNISKLKPRTLVARILDNDDTQVSNCWKCLTVVAMSELMHGYAKEAVEVFQRATHVVKRDTGSVPAWLTSRLDIAIAEAAKRNH